jgi:hypothetical protein
MYPCSGFFLGFINKKNPVTPEIKMEGELNKEILELKREIASRAV